MKSKVILQCDMCGKAVSRYPCQIKRHNFCSRQCLWAYNSKSKNPEGYRYRDFSINSKRMHEMNIQMNSERMTPEVRKKLSDKKYGSGQKTAYLKRHGRHEHRIVAEQMLGRPLQPGEVVHHIDADKWNNRPENLMVFPSQAAHAKWHEEHDREDVIENEVHTSQVSAVRH